MTSYELLLNAAPDPMLVIDQRGKVLFANAQVERVLGYAPAELVDHSIDCLLPAYARERHAQHRARYVAAPAVRQMGEGRELVALHKDGRELPVEVSLSPLGVADGLVIVCALRDVSLRKAVEAELRALNTTLEAKVSERTAHLELAIKELEAFNYAAAHDLRAPLRAMSGFANALLDYESRLDDDGVDCVQEIIKGAARMTELLDGLLALYRLTVRDIAPRRTDLSMHARGIARELAGTAPERCVTMVIEDGIEARLDPRLARPLLENLLGNAWKFTAHSAAAQIEFGASSLAGERALFVRDNGAGFDMAHADRLFAPFQRLHTVAEFPGMGIGLATVHRIVSRHGGRIWADARVGAGATFFFTLPEEAS